MIEKEELFASPSSGTRAVRLGWSSCQSLETNFALADTNGDGVVDFDEFIEFGTTAIQAMEHEKQARTAFGEHT